MKTVIYTTVILMMAALVASAQYNSHNLTLPENSEINRFTFRNLAIYPVYANEVFISAHKYVGNYSSLKTALEEKKVVITETGTVVNEVISTGEGTVNTLYVENISADTIFLMAGEVIKGGKQDRVLAQNVIIPPNSGKIDLSVFCVEQGRWSYQSDTDFNLYYHVSVPEVRKAAMMKKNQSAVWEEVSVISGKYNVKSSTGSYANLETSKEFTNTRDEYLKHFEKIFDNNSRIIGVVAICGDKIIGCDLFATNQIFTGQYVSLLHSYITKAVSEKSDKVTIDYRQVRAFLNNILEDEVRQEEKISGKGSIFKNNDTKLHITVF